MSEQGESIIQGMREALAYASGAPVEGTVVTEVDIKPEDFKTARKKLALTQKQMAVLLGTSTSGFRKWEQGKRRPNGAVRTLMKVIENEPEAFQRAMAKEA